ncbi:heme oxygenase isoform X2 [Halictus rubicundus]|uniref:heme oxygenase isoform X2 n=1 Tax=Halictus rubicundus TaxID=77578 RepID=UPI004035C965
MSNRSEDTFCKKMRKATREIHTISDALVNAKLAFGFLNDSVWADGLLVFYEIFLYLEGAMIRLKNTKIGLFPIDKLSRVKAFERDLDFYLGKGWMRNYSPRDSVVKYLMHLREIEDTDPTLLIAYIYHLHMGLLSGGIILRKKRQLMQKVLPFRKIHAGGNNITDFECNIFELKQIMRDTMNKVADTLDEDTRNKLIEESKVVFALNNEIIRSIRGAGTVLLKKTLYFVTICALMTSIYLIFFK